MYVLELEKKGDKRLFKLTAVLARKRTVRRVNHHVCRVLDSKTNLSACIISDDLYTKWMKGGVAAPDGPDGGTEMTDNWLITI